MIEFTANRIENDKNILLSLLKILHCLGLNVGGIKIKFDLKQTVEKVSIRCGNFGKETIIDVDLLETNYQ